LAAAGILAHVEATTKRPSRWCGPRPIWTPRSTSTRPVLPARELLADLLLELNPPSSALVEYRAMLSTDPNRFRSLLGEARAAKQTGDSATAHDAYRKLLALSKPVGPARPELAEARSYLTS
jgi:Tfp pilus assembly protein PilF